MPGTVSEGPSVALSFANNFWGKEDAGVNPLLERMHNAKQTCDELKAFYNARSSLEEEYARKLLALSRKPLGSQESGTLRASMDVMRGEVESMGKSHQNVAQQMKTELEEPLAAFAGAMKERRKIVQGGIEKLLKTKIQQTQVVNKTRDRYEQECLKIKGYLAQGHMVMGQEERKNKAKLEKTQINVATSNTEYEAAVKVLEETTGRWNRDWKGASDKFQDLEEERLDFTKSSLWTFANIASTVCVSDDASCEKIRLSLENCEVEKDILSFIKECGTGQEIPDPPKYINFCRGDISDTQSEASEDDAYSVAQFQRTINPAFRSSSPQPSTYESHHDPKSSLARELGHREPDTPPSRETTITPQKALADRTAQPQLDYRREPSRLQYEQPQNGQLASVPHDPYPMDGMTMLCRTGPPSDRSSAVSGLRPSSRDSHSEYSNPTSFSSMEPPSGKQSPIKQDAVFAPAADKSVQKKKSGFFQSHSPFRRKSKHGKEIQAAAPSPSNRNTWSAKPAPNYQASSFGRSQGYGSNSQNSITDRETTGAEPVDPRASFQLNVGNNVFDVATPDRRNTAPQERVGDELDPIAQALAELKGVTKQSSSRVSADHYSGMATPAPDSTSASRSRNAPLGNGALVAATRGTPPPSYDQPVSRLGLPQPAFTSKAMQQTSQKYQAQTQSMFNSSQSRSEPQTDYGSASRSRPGTRGSDMPRATSPMPTRSVSPRPSQSSQVMNNDGRQGYRSVSPNPYGGNNQQRGAPQSVQHRSSDQAYYRHNSPGDTARSVSPAPFRERPGSRMSGVDMSLQLAPAGDDGYGSQQGRHGGGRPRTSGNSRPMSYYGGQGGQQQQLAQVNPHQRSKSVADNRQFNRDGRPIIHFARAQYNYTAAIPEELSFGKGDTLAVLRLQDDGWWEAEVAGKNQRPGLVPSNYLQQI
ncbi:hypothetical protein V502_08899 [Pseudogymnoascus sp. VKM F-4520 (FW-2644)]|nr:hypothetical protein V502_08899 [Pseudogymnoascus sp. VKM F-4520 (FW-2644)]